MTRDEAIKQLDWYFTEDDGTASEPITKEAYATLKNILFSYDGCDTSWKSLRWQQLRTGREHIK